MLLWISDKGVKEMVKSRFKIAITIGVILTTVIGVWWWQWQAPYRTLKVFLKALQQNDIDTLYALSLDKERELGLTKEVVERIYLKCLKPALTKHRLVRIERADKGLLIREPSVDFWLWFEGLNRPIIVSPVRWPGSRKWRISFSSFSAGIIRFFIEEDDYRRFSLYKALGLKYIVSPRGPTYNVEFLLWDAKMKRFKAYFRNPMR